MKFVKRTDGRYEVTISLEEKRQRMVEGTRLALKGLHPTRIEDIVERARTRCMLTLFMNSTFAKKSELLIGNMELGHPNPILQSWEHQIARMSLIDGNRICANVESWEFVKGNNIDTSHSLRFVISAFGPLANDFNTLFNLLPLAIGFRYRFDEEDDLADVVGMDILYKDDFDNPVFKDK